MHSTLNIICPCNLMRPALLWMRTGPSDVDVERENDGFETIRIHQLFN